MHRFVLAGLVAVSFAGVTLHPTVTRTRAPYSSLHPGQLWLDTSGKPINAHGGGILYHEARSILGRQKPICFSELPEALSGRMRTVSVYRNCPKKVLMRHPVRLEQITCGKKSSEKRLLTRLVRWRKLIIGRCDLRALEHRLMSDGGA